MTVMTGEQPSIARRRFVHAATGTALGIALMGTGAADSDADHDHGHDHEPDVHPDDRRCPEATLEPSMVDCEGATMEGCADDHPETVALQEAVTETLETRYPGIGALIEDDFVPYFDTIGGDTGYSHWLSPEYIGDDQLLDPGRPESVLVDNETWRPIGVMFIATAAGEAVSPPPAVYDESVDDDSERESESEREADENEGDSEDDEARCSPWHAHAGFPGRFAWWYYQKVYGRDPQLRLPCRTPCMMHVWAVDHPDGVYAHGPPPTDDRDPAEPEIETDADPETDTLEWDALPDEVTPDRRPETYASLFR